MVEGGSSQLAALSMIPYRDVAVIINRFNRVSSLRRLVKWLLDAGQKNVIIIDNASTYAPLLEYLGANGGVPCPDGTSK